MGLMVAIPANQRSIAPVVEKNFQSRGFYMAVTENHIGFLLMPQMTSPGASQVILHAVRPPQRQTAVSNHAVAAHKPIADRHHLARTGYFRLRNRRRGRARGCPNEMAAQPESIGVRPRTQAKPVVAVTYVSLVGGQIPWPMSGRALPNALMQIYASVDAPRGTRQFAVLLGCYPACVVFRVRADTGIRIYE